MVSANEELRLNGGLIPDYLINSHRNQPDGVAGIYACKTLLNEHRPVCTMNIDLYGKYLDVTDNPDVWYPITGGGAIAYSTRNLTLATTALTTSACRAVINTTAYPITANFLEVTASIQTHYNGTLGTRYTVFGFQSAFSAYQATQRAIFYRGTDNLTYIGYNGGNVALSTLPLGREIDSGDILTIRLGRQEGSSNIDIVRFYVNGAKQFETTGIPTVNVYAGIGVFADSTAKTSRSIAIDYFGFKYVP